MGFGRARRTTCTQSLLVGFEANQQTVVVSSGCLGYADKKRYKGLEDLLFDFGAACLSGVLRLGM